VTSATLPEPSVVPTAAPDGAGFFALLRGTNPFAVNRIVPADAVATDVPGLHDRAYRRLMELARQASQQFPGIGAVLWGEPGIGKSHVLARLAQWANKEEIPLVSLANLQASPETLPRSLLRLVLNSLSGNRLHHFHTTTLYRLLLAAIRRALQADGTRKFSMPAAETAYQRQLDAVAEDDPARAAGLERTVFDVLFEFFRGSYLVWKGQEDHRAGPALRWLRGEALDPEEATLLRLPRHRGRTPEIALADDQEVKQVLTALAQLASWSNKPLILCFDQVDNLEKEQFSALARFLHALIDSAGNLLIVTAGVQPTLLRWHAESVVQESSWDRLVQYEIELQRATVKEARQLALARLQAVQESAQASAPLWRLVQDDVLFPLGEAWSQRFLANKVEIRPRDAINWAGEGWRREQEALRQLGDEAWLTGWANRQRVEIRERGLTDAEKQQRIDERTGLKLAELKQQRLREPLGLPPDADNLTGLLAALLRGCRELPACAALQQVEFLKKLSIKTVGVVARRF